MSRFTRDHEKVTGREATAIRLAVHPQVPGDRREWGASTVSDVAEATGLSNEEVRAHLSRLRAENAFDAPPAGSPPIVPIIGALALCVGGFVVWQRGQDARYDPHRALPASMVVQPPPTVRREVPFHSLAVEGVQQGPGLPPPGVHVDITGQACTFAGQRYSEEVKRMPLDMASDQLARSMATLMVRVALRDLQTTAPAGIFRDTVGNQVEPRPGFVHFTLTGWPGTLAGWIALPKFDDKFTAFAHSNEWVRPENRDAFLAPYAAKLVPSVKKYASEYYVKVASDQRSALECSGIDASKGKILPPPGYTVTYMGRRKDTQTGPLLAFAPVDTEVVQKRLELAIRNAIERDGRLPDGEWTEADRMAMKTAPPEVARVQISGPALMNWTFDLPLDGASRDAAIKREATIAIQAVTKANKDALTAPTDEKKDD